MEVEGLSKHGLNEEVFEYCSELLTVLQLRIRRLGSRWWIDVRRSEVVSMTMHV